jgi:hypothetical protein
MLSDDEAPFGEAATAYARRNWAVFPLRPRHKEPLVSKRDGGNGCLDATTDDGIIRAWWTRYPAANIGIATGAASGFFVVDIDPKHGGATELQRLSDKHGDLFETLTVITGSGGLHLYYRHVPWLGNSVARIGPGIDIRSDGGYIVAPPSIHPCGKRYSFVKEHGPEDRVIAAAPDWLISQARQGRVEQGAPPVSSEKWRQIFASGAAEGRRNDTIVQFVGYLLQKRLDPFLVLDIVMMWNDARFRPPLDQHEVTAVVNSVCGRELKRRAPR